MVIPYPLHQSSHVKNWNLLVHPVRDDYWLLKQWWWLLGDSYLATELSAIVSPRTLENCPHICPRAFWQHPSVRSAESQLIMRLVNSDLSSTCLPHKCNRHAQTWVALCGILAAFPSPHPLFWVSKPSPQCKRNGTSAQLWGLLELFENLLKFYAKMQGSLSKDIR